MPSLPCGDRLHGRCSHKDAALLRLGLCLSSHSLAPRRLERAAAALAAIPAESVVPDSETVQEHEGGGSPSWPGALALAQGVEDRAIVAEATDEDEEIQAKTDIVHHHLPSFGSDLVVSHGRWFFGQCTDKPPLDVESEGDVDQGQATIRDAGHFRFVAIHLGKAVTTAEQDARHHHPSADDIAAQRIVRDRSEDVRDAGTELLDAFEEALARCIASLAR
mmetsp:Transcript_89164/g.186326  ORF Transcript_89164/g.186326 Transcript_89164/m.186326 type:complete len:220 (-) Transcript_89164:66-725(-)|eukprot:CAMPEP_0206472752 /NCGR_PEP_ID=MMETSP0324_2-20121206/32408_1 /ASSEMBLY_ACC=CAM_ASM_000836 /TAXON_ID=2866 /ORGANISM="Crypthecodinium cohnii, Strain Seligo" /LENGTH=219 /DNA_ID=CAMNT_0053947453 /DNA_START=404 /DNA_END=1063 /DNA_ORIENTATION=-